MFGREFAETKVPFFVAKYIRFFSDLVLLYDHQLISEICHASSHNYKSNCEWAPNKLNAFLVYIRDWRGQCIPKRGFAVQLGVRKDEMNTIEAPIIQCSMADGRIQSKLYNVQGAHIPNCLVEEAYKGSSIS